MAKGNPIIGNQRGSIGDVTLSVYRGAQVAKKRNRAPRNPKTTPQMLQRMCMAQATKLAAFFSPFIDHSFQGKEYGGVSKNYFVKRAIERIRLGALESYRGSDVEYNFQPAQFPYAVLAPVPFSEGTMQPLKYSERVSENNAGLDLDPVYVGFENNVRVLHPHNLFQALGIPQDGQLTMISVKSIGTQSVVGGFPVTGDNVMEVPSLSAIRLRLDQNYTGDFVLEAGQSYSVDDLMDNGFLIETEGSVIGAKLRFEWDNTDGVAWLMYDWKFLDGFGQDAFAYVAVASLYEAKKWLRSSQDIKVINKNSPNFNEALNSWIGSSVSLLKTDRLLNYEGLVNP